MTLTDRRRFPALFAVIAALAVAGAVLGLLLAPVQAQESEALVSNIGKIGSDTHSASVDGVLLVAQAFTVGDDDGDYTLTSIELPFKDREISSENIGKLTVSVWSVDTETSDDDPLVGMEPVASLYTLTNPSSIAANTTATFTAPAGSKLDAGTTYLVMVDYDHGAQFGGARWRTMDSDGEDSGRAPGWTIANKSLTRNRSMTDWSTNNRAAAVRVNGSAISTENRPSEIRASWTRPDLPVPDNESNGNLRVNCASTEPFRAFWERPKTADEWEAEVEADSRYGASNVSFTMSNTGGRWPELSGTVRIADGEFSVVSIRVRGRFGEDGWGAWSRPTELFCNPPGGL